MDDSLNTTQATIEVRSHMDTPDEATSQLLDVAPGMMYWTWAVFLLVSFILYKYAWKPILSGLDKRETYLRDSITHADHIESEMAVLGQTRERLLAEADEQAKAELIRARKTAVETAKEIEQQARQDALAVQEKAAEQIQLAERKARRDLRTHSINAAIALAEEVLNEQFDDTKHHELTDRLLEKL